MTDRYRYPRPRSPTLYNPARASLPINVSGYPPSHEHHLHVVPAGRREIIPGPRSSNSSLQSVGPITTTTYKISAEPPTRGSSVREGSRTRRSTVDNSLRPQIVTAAPRIHHRPVVHSGGGRTSPSQKNPYRSSEEEFYSVPATSRKHGHHHQKRYSATMDNADMNRLAHEREGSRLQPPPRREVLYAGGSRNRPVYPGSVVPHRHADTVADDYGDNGYGYTNPRDLVQYDLNNAAPPPAARHHARRDSIEGGRRERPSSITGYNDVAPRTFEGRERGPPPPSMRGFDRIPARIPPTVPFEWERPEVRLPVAPMDPIARPSPFEPVRPAEPRREPFEARTGEPRRDSSRRPVSLYHDREPRRSGREDYYEARDEDPRYRGERHRHDPRYDDEPRSGHPERPDRPEKSEKKDDHKSGRDALATGLSLAGAALGVKAFKDAGKDDRDESEEPRRRRDRDRDYDDEPRRRRDRDEREDLSGRDPKERRHRDDSSERDFKERSSAEAIDLSGRDPKERHHDRDGDPERRRSRPEPSINGTEISSRDESSASDEAIPRRRPHRESVGPDKAFNPKDTMDLKALKEALNNKSPPASTEPIPKTPIRTPRESMNKPPQELAAIRTDLVTSQPRIVTPPPLSAGPAPVKGILRQPREKFPEDPAPIREGVAPLKDAKKDGVPPDARWTKISRKLVNPEALEAGKERYEAREDFVIVLRVLSRDEVQGYAEVTERIRSAREEADEALERESRRRARRERHERHKRERSERGEREPSREERRERRKHRDKENRSNSETESTEDEHEKPKMLEQGPVMSGGLGDIPPEKERGKLALGSKRDSK